MDTAQAYVWRLQNFVLGEHILKPRPENPSPVKVRISIYFNTAHFFVTLVVNVLQDL